MLGEKPSSVTAQYGTVHDPKRFAQVEETIVWQSLFPGGAIAYAPFRGRTTNGDLHFPDINQQAAQLDGIGKLILDNKPLPDHISGKEGLIDLCAMEAIYHAANTGSRVDVVYD
jgi:predicted dehydrogenase